MRVRKQLQRWFLYGLSESDYWLSQNGAFKLSLLFSCCFNEPVYLLCCVFAGWDIEQKAWIKLLPALWWEMTSSGQRLQSQDVTENNQNRKHRVLWHPTSRQQVAALGQLFLSHEDNVFLTICDAARPHAKKQTSAFFTRRSARCLELRA